MLLIYDLAKSSVSYKYGVAQSSVLQADLMTSTHLHKLRLQLKFATDRIYADAPIAHMMSSAALAACGAFKTLAPLAVASGDQQDPNTAG